MLYNKFHALHSLKPDGVFKWIGTEYSGLTGSDKPTESELDAEVIRLNNAEPMRLLRLERDRRLAACDWRASSDLTLADTWKTYRQSLRNLPASASPTLDSNHNLDLTSVTWPTEPS
jgi:hypothetical protein|tara:strand:- start:40 stop:390 length:351 start_codon:yes stop_codon:yes gene_type:complete